MNDYAPTVDRCRQCGGWVHMDNECVTCIIRINRQGNNANGHLPGKRSVMKQYQCVVLVGRGLGAA